MNSKQHTILRKILEKYELPQENKIIFKQHRNLNEFRYFSIEKINPNHRIRLYGTLKKNNKKNKTTRSLINVGEILIGFTTILLNLKILSIYSDIILLYLSSYIICAFFFYFFGGIKIWTKNIDIIIQKIYRFFQKNSSISYS